MISGFQYCIEDIIELQNMPAKSTIANINTGSWCIVYAVVPYRNISGNVNLYTCSLFFNSAYIVDEVIFRNTLLWIMIGLWTGCFIQFIIRYIILVPERRRTYGIGFSYKGYSAGTGTTDMVTTNGIVLLYPLSIIALPPTSVNWQSVTFIFRVFSINITPPL